MDNPISWRLKRAKRILYIDVFLLIAGVLMIVVGLMLNQEISYLLGIIILMLCVIFFCIYSSGLGQFKHSIKALKQRGINYEKIINDINFSVPSMPKSGICIGQQALFFYKPGVLLDYESIVWIYIRKKKAYGIITINEEFIIATITGHKYIVNANKDEFLSMLNMYRMKFPPYLIIGYGKQQYQKYTVLVKTYRNQYRRNC